MTRKSSHDLDVAPLRASDLPAAHALSQGVSWPHRLQDWAFCLRIGKGIAVRRAGELLGTAMAWDYGSVGTLGLIIVAPGCQGRGIGSLLVERCLASLSAPAALLHATPAGAKVYARQGFQTRATVSQHQGVVPAQPPAGASPDRALRPAVPGDLAMLAGLDTAATGFARQHVIALLLHEADIVVLERDGAPVGFSAMRPFGRGLVIGPVVAPGPSDARMLVTHWLARSAGRFVRVDTRGESGLAPWLASQGLQQVDEVAVMTRGELPATAPGIHNFALVSQALA